MSEIKHSAMKRYVYIILTFGALALLGSCAVVHQIDRKNLSTRKMQFEPEPEKQKALEEFQR